MRAVSYTHLPSQIETVLLGQSFAPNYQIVVDRVNNTDTMRCV